MIGLTEAGLGAALLLGAMGSAHCMTMCAGIACGLGMSVSPGDDGRRGWRAWSCLLGYQLGRVTGYAIVGALAGGLFAGAAALADHGAMQRGVHLLQALVLVLLGCYLTGLWRAPLEQLERLGAGVWGVLRPLARSLLPVQAPHQAFAFGLLWGALPCPLVYGALAIAIASADAAIGALTMAMFGLGTVPAMLLVSAFGQGLKKRAPLGVLRRTAGALMLLLGVAAGAMSVAHGADDAASNAFDALCTSAGIEIISR